MGPASRQYQPCHPADGGTLLTRVDLKYDAFGNRIERDLWTSDSGVTVVSRCGFDGWKTHLDASGHSPGFVGMENFDTWIDLDGNNSATVRRFYGDQVNQFIARDTLGGNTVAWYLTDRLGSVRQIADAAGAVQDTITYDPYGGILTESNNSVGDRNKWAGYDYDSYAGVYWVHIRWYDPVIAVWITQDPLGLAPDINRTRYVHNMPMNVTDPSGMDLFASGQKAADEVVQEFQAHRIKVRSVQLKGSPFFHILPEKGFYRRADLAPVGVWFAMSPLYTALYSWRQHYVCYYFPKLPALFQLLPFELDIYGDLTEAERNEVWNQNQEIYGGAESNQGIKGNLPMPSELLGTWQMSICVDTDGKHTGHEHAWIRFRKNGQEYTVSSAKDGRDNVDWNGDRKRPTNAERTLTVKNPKIITKATWNYVANCVTFAKKLWRMNTGEMFYSDRRYLYSDVPLVLAADINAKNE